MRRQSFFCEKALQEIEEKRMLPFAPRVYDFLCRDRNTGKVFVLRETGKWYRENFGEDYECLNPDGVTVECVLKKEMSLELIETLSQMGFRENASFLRDISEVHDALYRKDVEINLAGLICLIILTIFSVYVMKRKKDCRKWVLVVWLSLLLTFLVFVLMMIGG